MTKEIEDLKDVSQAIYSKIKTSNALSPTERAGLDEIISLLDQGKIRIASKEDDTWITHSWIKQAVVAYFHFTKPFSINYGMPYFDSIVYKYAEQEISHKRIVPSAYVRYGAYIGNKTIVMPSFINIGAHVGENSMIDTYASIGCCAQIGNHVHISAGTGIGGVLEPLQAFPTIIEDHCFIGARSEISEGVIVREGSVLAAGLFISQSTRIYNRQTGEITYGEIPKNSVVVPGTVPSKDGSYSIAAAIIVKEADHKTRSKTQLNNLLRSFD